MRMSLQRLQRFQLEELCIPEEIALRVHGIPPFLTDGVIHCLEKNVEG